MTTEQLMGFLQELSINKYTIKIFLSIIIGFSLLTFLGCSDSNHNNVLNKPENSIPTVRNVSFRDTSTVATNAKLAVYFSKIMDSTTITTNTVTLKETSSQNSVTITVSYSGEIATIKPSSNLKDGTNYTLTLTTGIKDLNTTALLQNYSFTFITSGTAAVTYSTPTGRVLPILKTGQTTSNTDYDDGYYEKGATRSYTRGSDIVIDNTTGLQWQDDATPSVMMWSSAVSYCQSITLGGYSDWRLPDIYELLSITDYGRDDPSIDSTFSNYAQVHDGTGNYWSATNRASYTNSAFYVNFAKSNQWYANKTDSKYVRCVRNN